MAIDDKFDEARLRCAINELHASHAPYELRRKYVTLQRSAIMEGKTHLLSSVFYRACEEYFGSIKRNLKLVNQ